MKKQTSFSVLQPWGALLYNLLVLVACYMVCRLVFWAENHSLFPGLDLSETGNIVAGGLRFDLAAIAYTNALYLLLTLLPLPAKERPGWQGAMRLLFTVVNGICLAANLVDAVYFPFIKRRSTAAVFSEFHNDDLTSIVTYELVHHWYLTLLGILFFICLWKTYRTPHFAPQPRRRYFVSTVAGLLVGAVAVFFGIRGGFDLELRPIHNGIARQLVRQPAHATLVLNTPFSILRTAGKHPYPQVHYYDDAELERVFTPVRQMTSADTGAHRRENIVILLLESFSNNYSKRLNPAMQGEGYMPFLDSLMSEGLTFRTSLANGLRSIDAQASVLTSIPMLVENFLVSQAAMNDVEGLGTYMKQLGYTTAYFHGADNGSLGIDGFVRSCGFDRYYGRDEYADDSDWDHHWGIWDEPFLQFFGRTLSGFHEPFCAALFTLTSHHPYQIPPAYRDTFPDEALPIFKTIRYTDHSLRRFFDYARRQPWYDHTLFVLTGDHTNQLYPASAGNDFTRFEVPLFFFHPTDSLWQGQRDGVAQQTDILPTLLHYVGYEGPYFAFGNDLLSQQPPTPAISYINDLYQMTDGQWLLQFDGDTCTALYDLPHDPMLQANLAAAPRTQQQRQLMERPLKAIIQQYMTRMNANQLKSEDGIERLKN